MLVCLENVYFDIHFFWVNDVSALIFVHKLINKPQESNLNRG